VLGWLAQEFSGAVTGAVMGERAISHQDDAARMPWYRRDVFRACKTGEVIEAQPFAYRLRVAGFVIAVAAPLLVASNWFFKTWIPHYHAELDQLAKIDPVLSVRKFAEFASLLLLAPVLVCVIVVLVATVRISRVLRAGRWPLPNAKVMRRTEVVAGRCARVPAALAGIWLLACMFAAWSSYVRLVAMFWDGWLDKVVARPAAVVALRSSQYPAADFDIMMRLHHDVFASR